MYISTHPYDVGAPEYSALLTVIENGVWWAMCQCTSGAPVATPTPPAYPATAPVINPTTPQTGGASSCWSGTNTANFPNSGAVFPFMPAVAGGSLMPGSSPWSVQVNGYWNFVSGTGPKTDVGVVEVQYCNSVGCNPNIAAPDATGLFNLHMTNPGQVYADTFYIPSTAVRWGVYVTASNATGNTLAYTVDAAMYCGTNAGNPTNQVCCPTDPAIIQRLDNLAYLTELIWSNLPVRIPNYVAGTAHAGLSGNGAQAVASTCVAVRIETTTLPAVYGAVAGNPNTLIDIGWITPTTAEGTEAGVQLTRQVQVIPLPEASTSVAYSLQPGQVITITELQAG